MYSKRDEFQTYHPVVNFTFFCAVIVLSVVLFHPACLIVSLGAAFIYAWLLQGSESIKYFFKFPFIIMVLIFFLNPIFVHRGMTALFYIGETAVTNEAFVYGALAALMTGSVIMWFYCYGIVMTQDRFMAVFGKRAPATSLVFSMVLRFIPRLKVQAANISAAQRGLNGDVHSGTVRPDDESTHNEVSVACVSVASKDTASETQIMHDPNDIDDNENSYITERKNKKHDRHMIKNAIGEMSILTTWALENSIETADSMRARGYGLSGRTNYSDYIFEKRDGVMIVLMIIALVMVVIAKATGVLFFAAYPLVQSADDSWFKVVAIMMFTAMSLMPPVLTIIEEIRWKRLISKI